MTISLNNRHKVGLFMTSLVAGLCLTLGAGLRESIGVVLISLTLTWAFGAENRLLRYVIASISLLLMIGPLLQAYISHRTEEEHYKSSVAAFRKRLPAFAHEHPDLTPGFDNHHDIFDSLGATPDGENDPFTKIAKKDPNATYGGATQGQLPPLPPGYKLDPFVLTVPEVGRVQFPGGTSSKEVALILRRFDSPHAPEWFINALEAGIAPMAIQDLETPTLTPPSFSFSTAIADGAVIEMPALILALMFFGSLISDRKEHKASYHQ